MVKGLAGTLCHAGNTAQKRLSFYMFISLLYTVHIGTAQVLYLMLIPNASLKFKKLLK